MYNEKWKKYPAVKKLFDIILEHRAVCPHWNTKNPCHDCHYGTLTQIEKELGIRD